MTGATPPFHLAMPVHDLSEARAFYGGLLGCVEGRSAARWVDYDFFGHQLSLHLVDGLVADGLVVAPAGANAVDGDQVPIPHFGAVLEWDAWHALARVLESAQVEFVIEPRVRFSGQPGEQGTMFLRDPSGNHIEFKGFRDSSSLFASD